MQKDLLGKTEYGIEYIEKFFVSPKGRKLSDLDRSQNTPNDLEMAPVLSMIYASDKVMNPLVRKMWFQAFY